MKKLKPISMLITSFAVIVACIVPSFSAVKAETLTPGTVGAYGSYYAETFYSNNNQSVMNNYVIDLGFIQFNMNVANCSCFHYHYDFKNYYSGQIHLTITTAVSYTLSNCTFTVTNGQFSNVPNKTTNSSSKTFVLTFENVPYIDFYLYHNGTSVTNFVFLVSTAFTATFDYMTPHDSEIELLEHIDDVQMMIYDYMTEDMETTFQSMLTAIQNSVVYEIPAESLPAYYFVRRYDNELLDLQYSPADIRPYYNVEIGTRTKQINLGAHETIYLYYYTSHNDQGLEAENEYITVANNARGPVINYRVKRTMITNNSDERQTFYLHWIRAGKIFPLYFGYGDNMSQEMQSITGHQSETYTTSILTQILNAIRSLTGENLYDTSTYDNAVDDAGDFMDNVVNTMPSVNDVQSDINALPSFDPTDSNFKLDDMAGFTNYVYIQMTNIFPFLKTLVILGLIVILMKVFL